MNAEFTVGEDDIIFTTKKNGDRILIRNAAMDAENAAKLAQMINENMELHVEVSTIGG